MVYRGRPSAACFLCRERRIKCDKKKSECSQCTRMRVTCPGYRDSMEQVFRDESESVVRRAEKIYGRSSVAKVPKPGSCVNVVDETVGVVGFECNLTTYPMFRMSEPVQDVAVAHFMSSYVPRSHFDYLPWMYRQAGTSSALSATVHAASIASLAQELGQADLMHTARRSYAIALMDTNIALADSCTASSDSTLVSVLLLSLFEALVWARAKTPDSWATHTRGAFDIIELRGSRQLKSSIGRQLFAQVANIVCVNSLQRRARLPQGLIGLVEEALHYEPDFPPYRLARLTSQISSLVADIHMGMLTDGEALDSARQLDEEYTIFADSLPSTWQYLKIKPDRYQPGLDIEGFHQYPSHRASQLWNSHRMTRILLNEIVHAHARELPPPFSHIVQHRAVYNIEKMAAQICASIPQFADPLTSTTTKVSSASLLWPLSAVRGASLASEAVRSGAVERLKHLALESRVPQAGTIALEGSDFDALQDGLHMFYVS